jgi:UDP-N-acetyl-D-glucosamine dehydrogenase
MRNHLEEMMASLEERIKDNSARVAVIGLGYVGFPLAQRARDVGFPVVGIDKYLSDERRGEIEAAGIEIDAVCKPQEHYDVVLMCVPTPLAEGQRPDISFIVEATEDIARNCGGGEMLVVLESTSYPGTTREVLLPILEGAGRSLGSDLYLAYAPERIDPGSNKAPLAQIPRLVGGMDRESGLLAAAFYEKLVSEVTLVPTPEVAEMAKLLENIFRAVNIALVNEMALLCRRMGIDIWAVVEAAATKPFGFMPFQPGPGLGGHCIPVDPFYLAWKAKEYDFNTEFIELAGKINRSMPSHVVQWVSEALGEVGKDTNGARVLVVGVAYKEDVGDTRESPALKTIELLAEQGARVSYTDSYVERIEVAGREYSSVPLDNSTVEQVDCVVIMTAHSDVDLELLGSLDIPVVDTRNALRRGGL